MLSRRFFLVALGAGGLAAFHAGNPHPRRFVHARRTAHALGTHVSIELYHQNPTDAEHALDAAFAELNRVEDVLSLYRPHSQVCRLNREGLVQNPHRYLLEVLRCAQDFSARSHGAFDVTVQPLWHMYYAARKRGCLPTESEIAVARERVGYRKLDVSDRCVRFTEPGMAVTLNGIAQGYAADRVAAVLQEHDVVHALINTGEVGALGTKPSMEPWTIGIQDPRNADAFAAVAHLNRLYLSTSGDYSTTFTEDYAYNHIFNPHTGVSPRYFSSVSIAAPSGMLADVFSTTLFVLDPVRGSRLLTESPGVSAYYIDAQNRASCSNGFPLVSGGGLG